ncbi:hypothetical protein MP638_006442 [Amoeboaphelidium occidentale]|nr:hypothetical protein MP638_006442 [Amoeboaphelidium occidentale]
MRFRVHSSTSDQG